MAAKRQRTNIPYAEVLELVLQDDGQCQELSDLEYGDLSEDEEALINKGVDPDLDLAEQRPQVQSKKSIQYGGKRVGLFDSSDEEGFWGFTREDIPLRGEESDSNASGESDFSLSEASEEESSEESEDEDADETRGVEIYETR
ncbi:unnamed protein product [Porites lobata]|uniref:Uncharacterized protein n=1 Tax=Porites lobata TaxID=104759 RepID=A0ABN8QFA7_9CNID|nr:unnamed protein product [Porites lobata]